MLNPPLSPYRKLWAVIGFVVVWLSLLLAQPEPSQVVAEHYKFSLLGVLGAIFANSTGAGGGVVFIPAFHQLGFSELQSVATSFAIQCCGMSAGALTWLYSYRHNHRSEAQWQGLIPAVLTCAAGAVVALLATQWLAIGAPAATHLIFSVFSVGLGVVTLYCTLTKGKQTVVCGLLWFDYVALAAIGLLGGVITAWLSVGVGELMAVYLILRGFNVSMAIAGAVMVSALSVWAAIPHHIWSTNAVAWQVVLFAGPSAILGGIIARTIVEYLSAKIVKLIFSAWVLLTGLFILLAA
ncbi:sulfite exporter TauE/SafE family protein [Neiella sp. HB171785]|uniref:Probable membrane transporter protein n=2 Tax=Neiella litorisoli TaxID=2771431 RepID=A0A8J6QUC5_9GAMM|nr:sulfite exporter TauE/SafE family protein [Neiella litorisoli]